MQHSVRAQSTAETTLHRLSATLAAAIILHDYQVRKIILEIGWLLESLIVQRLVQREMIADGKDSEEGELEVSC